MVEPNLKIQIRVKKTDIGMEMICLFTMLVAGIYIMYLWLKMPDTIAIQYNLNGQVENYGHKTTLLILLPIAILVYIGLTLLERYPHTYHYLVEITQSNMVKQYQLAIRFIRVVKLETVILFLHTNILIMHSAIKYEGSLGIGFLPLLLIAVFTSILVYIRQSIKYA